MTVKRVLRSLEATHPELYEFQTLSSERHLELVTEFLAKEAGYLQTLKIMGVSLSNLSFQKRVDRSSSQNDIAYLCSVISPLPHSLECLIAFISRISVYHEHIARRIQNVPCNKLLTSVDWVEVFGWKVDQYQLSWLISY